MWITRQGLRSHSAHRNRALTALLSSLRWDPHPHPPGPDQTQPNEQPLRLQPPARVWAACRLRAAQQPGAPGRRGGGDWGPARKWQRAPDAPQRSAPPPLPPACSAGAVAAGAAASLLLLRSCSQDEPFTAAHLAAANEAAVPAVPMAGTSSAPQPPMPPTSLAFTGAASARLAQRHLSLASSACNAFVLIQAYSYLYLHTAWSSSSPCSFHGGGAHLARRPHRRAGQPGAARGLCSRHRAAGAQLPGPLGAAGGRPSQQRPPGGRAT